MNRAELTEQILKMKDLGFKQIYVFLNGKEVQIPTKWDGEPTGTLSQIMEPNEHGTFIASRDIIK